MNSEQLHLIYAYLVVNNNAFKKQGSIPTIDMLIEMIEEEINASDSFDLDLANAKKNEQI